MYTDHITLWYSYIEDIFVVWDGPSELLQSFLHILNENSLNLKFTMDCSVEIQCGAEKLKQRLLMRGYSITSLKKAYQRATQKTRQELLYSLSLI